MLGGRGKRVDYRMSKVTDVELSKDLSFGSVDATLGRTVGGFEEGKERQLINNGETKRVVDEQRDEKASLESMALMTGSVIRLVSQPGVPTYTTPPTIGRHRHALSQGAVPRDAKKDDPASR